MKYTILAFILLCLFTFGLCIITVILTHPAPVTQPVTQPVLAPLPDPLPVKITPTIVAFGAEWCDCCKKAEQKLQGLNVIRVDADKYPNLCQEYQVTTLPTFFVYVGDRFYLKTNNVDDALAEYQLLR
jgi:hypothetical protein